MQSPTPLQSPALSGKLASCRSSHQGQFNLSETGERWLPFTSDQLVVTSRPGFDWEGRIRLLPGVNIRVHDAYIAGEGMLHAALFGWLPVVNDRAELARGELLRFLAEAGWYPTALLPSQGVRWDGLDDRAARATLVDGNLTATLDCGPAGSSTDGSLLLWRSRVWALEANGPHRLHQVSPRLSEL